jgi:hypothetical protein
MAGVYCPPVEPEWERAERDPALMYYDEMWVPPPYDPLHMLGPDGQNVPIPPDGDAALESAVVMDEECVSLKVYAEELDTARRATAKDSAAASKAQEKSLRDAQRVNDDRTRAAARVYRRVLAARLAGRLAASQGNADAAPLPEMAHVWFVHDGGIVTVSLTGRPLSDAQSEPAANEFNYTFGRADNSPMSWESGRSTGPSHSFS